MALTNGRKVPSVSPLQAARKAYLAEEMKVARSAIDAQMREHDRLVFFSITAFGASYWAMINAGEAAAGYRLWFVSVPIMMGLYGIIRERAISSFARLADMYVSNVIEKDILGRDGGFIAFYGREKRQSKTAITRRQFWWAFILIAFIAPFVPTVPLVRNLSKQISNSHPTPNQVSVSITKDGELEATIRIQNDSLPGDNNKQLIPTLIDIHP